MLKSAHKIITISFLIIIIGACKQNNSTGEVFYQEALLLIEAKEYYAALQKLDACIETDPDYAMAYLQNGITYRRLGMYKESLSNLQKFLTYDTLLDIGYTERAILRLKLHDFKGALNDCQRAIIINSDYYKAYYCRARVRADLGFPIHAEDDFTKSIILKADYGKAYLYRADNRLVLNNTTGACQDFSKAAEYGQFNAFSRIEKHCFKSLPASQKTEKIIIRKEIQVEKEKLEEKKESSLTENQSKTSQIKADSKFKSNIFAINSIILKTDIPDVQNIQWKENYASPDDLYIHIRQIDNNNFYLNFIREGEMVYEGNYMFHNLKGGYLYKRTNTNVNEIIRINRDLQDCVNGDLISNQTILEILNSTQERAAKLIF